ncbi:hypothetical protein [Paenibacillus cellulositrophicus]|uniref:hypothetical protein n=1 Tax=Paenibacillus cellulositrophicus TaxID=562959 RepID=UPI003D95BBC7
MRKYISAILLILLIASIFFNVSMLYQDYKSTPNNGEIKGSYELFMVDIRAAQTSINTYFEETNEKKKQLALYDLLSSTYKMDSDLKLLDVKSKLLYKRGLSPLSSFTSDFVITSSRLFTSYTMEGKDITDDAKKYKSYIDDLNNVLKDTTMQDKRSTKEVFDKVDHYSKEHFPMY